MTNAYNWLLITHDMVKSSAVYNPLLLSSLASPISLILFSWESARLSPVTYALSVYCCSGLRSRSSRFSCICGNASLSRSQAFVVVISVMKLTSLESLLIAHYWSLFYTLRRVLSIVFRQAMLDIWYSMLEQCDSKLWVELRKAMPTILNRIHARI